MFGTRERKERSVGTKLGLKPQRSESPKSAFLRRPHRPGFHGETHRLLSEFGRQLLEKQKIRFTYGVRERELKQLFHEALQYPGVTSEVLMGFLERRLDNVLFRLGIAPSRSVARQLVGHGHILVNGRKVTIPSYRMKKGDCVTARSQSAGHPAFRDLAERLKGYESPVWLHIDPLKLEGRVLDDPKDFDVPFDVGLVVDYYSK